MKNLEIQDNFKINFLRRNGKMARLNNFQANLKNFYKSQWIKVLKTLKKRVGKMTPLI